MYVEITNNKTILIIGLLIIAICYASFAVITGYAPLNEYLPLSEFINRIGLIFLGTALGILIGWYTNKL